MLETVDSSDIRSLVRRRLPPNSENVIKEEKVIVNKNRIAGTAKEIRGSVKETMGKATGDAKLQADGKADKVEGKFQNAVGRVKDAARNALKGIDM